MLGEAGQEMVEEFYRGVNFRLPLSVEVHPGLDLCFLRLPLHLPHSHFSAASIACFNVNFPS